MSTVTPLLTVSDIARRLALSEKHVRERLVTRADFPAPAFQIGWTRRWEPEDVERWMKNQRKTANSLRTSRRAQ